MTPEEIAAKITSDPLASCSETEMERLIAAAIRTAVGEECDKCPNIGEDLMLALKAERDEADRRAGAAERKLATLVVSIRDEASNLLNCHIETPNLAKDALRRMRAFVDDITSETRWSPPTTYPQETWVIGEWRDSFGQIGITAFYCDNRDVWFRGATGRNGEGVLRIDAPIRWRLISEIPEALHQ